MQLRRVAVECIAAGEFRLGEACYGLLGDCVPLIELSARGDGECFVHVAHVDCRPARWPESPRTVVQSGLGLGRTAPLAELEASLSAQVAAGRGGGMHLAAVRHIASTATIGEVV